MSTVLSDPDSVLFEEPFASARFTVDEYFGMVARDAFADVGRVELLEGLLVRKMTKNPPHRVALGKTERALRRLIGAGWHLANQEPIRLSSSAPEPDLTIVRGDVEDYLDHHPGPNDVALVIEVSEDSLRTDRRKSMTYAADGVREYWIVNLPQRCIEVHREPEADAKSPHFADHRIYLDGESVAVVIDGQELGSLQVADLLP